jgi:ribose 5-phosphate isomerase B
MKIAIGSDHGGFRMKERLREYLAGRGHQVIDFGTHDAVSVDYPVIGEKVSREVAAGRARYGVLICTTGIGMSIAANKVPGVRAALCFNRKCAYYARGHNNANVVVFSGKYLTAKEAEKTMDVWLKTRFFGGRHRRRVDRMMKIEKRGGGK